MITSTSNSLAIGLVGGFAVGLTSSLIFCLTSDWKSVLAVGTVGLIAALIFYMIYFRVIIYPFYLIRCILPLSFEKNPYLRDDAIWLPLPFIRRQFLQLSWTEPEVALQFAVFLFKHRPLQRKLAFEITHTATAAQWYHHPLSPSEMRLPEIDAQDKKSRLYRPSSFWLRHVKDVRSNLSTAKQQNHINLKKAAWSVFHDELKRLEQTTLQQNGSWKDSYLKAIRRWIEESRKQLETLDMQLRIIERASPNKYRLGEALQPDQFGQETFVGREDLRDELSIRIFSSATMPTFLLQGQRRVGKTSLLNFLQTLLGSGFLIVVQDFQSDACLTLSSALHSFEKEARKKLETNDEAQEPYPEQTLEGWQRFKIFFEALAAQEKRKIILAFDEYENFHKLLKAAGADGERLLEAMRSFSQHQNQVIFLFTGLLLFADLGEPDFSRYFVHAQRLKVDYLKRADALRLITDPYPEFRLIYPPELAEQMADLTQGHPALLQHLCYEMVTRANLNNQREMTPADLDAVLEKVLDRSNAVMTNFWVHFCQGTLKQTVKAVMERQPVTCKADLARLLDYGFIVEDEPGFYKLRAPLFEQWMELHADSFE